MRNSTGYSYPRHPVIPPEVWCFRYDFWIQIPTSAGIWTYILDHSDLNWKGKVFASSEKPSELRQNIGLPENFDFRGGDPGWSWASASSLGFPGWSWATLGSAPFFYSLEVHRSPAAFYYSKDLSSSKTNHHRTKVVVDVSWDNSPRFHQFTQFWKTILVARFSLLQNTMDLRARSCDVSLYVELRVKKSLQNAETETTNIFDSKILIRQWPNKMPLFHVPELTRCQATMVG